MFPQSAIWSLLAWITVTSAFTSYVTFNDYATQSSVTCPGGNPGDDPALNLYGAAASDNSVDLFHGSCNYSMADTQQNPDQWSGFLVGTDITR